MTQMLLPARMDRRAGIQQQLSDLGLRSGEIVLVHCSLRQVGRAVGGPKILLRAIQELIGPAGTVVVPTQTANNSTTSRIYFDAVRGMGPSEITRYQENLPGFDSARTPSYGMGAFAEHVRRHRLAVRSPHPQASFSALGPAAAELMAVHDMDCHLGERSPLAALYDAGALILLLGVGYDKCTAMHLAEYRLAVPPPSKAYRCFVMEAGHRVQHDFTAPDLDESPFAEIGRQLDPEPFVRRGRVGGAMARIIPMHNLVEFAIDWLGVHRSAVSQ